MIAFGCSRSRVEEVSARLWVCGSFFGPLSFWGVFSPLVVLLLALRGELMECRAFEVARGAKAEESRKTCTSRGKFWHKSRDVPRKLLSFGDRFRIGKLTQKEPLFTGSRDLELLPTQPSPVGYLGFCARIGSAGCIFYEAIIGCAERCGKGGVKTLEGVFFEAEPSARVSRRHFLGRLTWAHLARCRAHAVTHVLSYACC